MIERFRTHSGSTYEVDHDNHQIRRLSGNHPPTARQGSDERWKPYQGISEILTGQCVLVSWEVVGNVARCTLTSEVVECGELV